MALTWDVYCPSVLVSSWCNSCASCVTALSLSSSSSEWQRRRDPPLSDQGPNRRHHQTQRCFRYFLQSPDILFHSDCNLSVRTVVTLAPNRLLKFKRSPPSLPNTPNAALNEAILFIGAVGGLWVTLCPFKKIICFPFNGLRMTNCFQGKMKLGKLQRNISSTSEVWHPQFNYERWYLQLFRFLKQLAQAVRVD